MFCSVVIPTVGRPTLSRAVLSVLNQKFNQGSCEVIVVNDSGRSLPAEPWQKSDRVQIVQTNRRERSVARNTGAALACGKYLGFLDDDDWLLRDALQHFWILASQDAEAAWLYGGLQVVNEASECLAEVNSGLSGNSFAQIMGGAWAPIQASLIRATAFFDVGGYDPSICGTEDLDLCRRVALHGTFANTPAPIACLLRGETWHTSTDYLRAPDDIRYSRDRVLGEPGAFRRMLKSVDSSYWRGRILRVYSSAVLFNLRRSRPFRAMDRFMSCLGWCVQSGSQILSTDFWRGARAHHAPNTLHFVMKALE